MSEIDLSAGDVTYPPGGALGPRRQRHLQLVLVHAGEARITVDGEHRARLGPGDAGLLLPGHTEQFAFAAAEATRHAWIEGAPARAPLDRLALLPPARPASASLVELVRTAVAAARAPLPTARPLLAALGSAALWRYVGEAEAGPAGGGDAVERARAFLHAHIADPDADLPAAARAAHVSPAHLVRRFRAELGVTPVAYLWEQRVAAGVELLAQTGLPVGEIAARVGFRSGYHFSRRVRQATGLAPTRVRAERWGGGVRSLADAPHTAAPRAGAPPQERGRFFSGS